MKLAEAISLREDLQQRIEQLHCQLLDRVKQIKDTHIQFAEKPEKLYNEFNADLAQLRSLCIQIELTCAHATYENKPLDQLFIEQRVMDWRVQMMRELHEAAILMQTHHVVRHGSALDTVRIGKQISTLEELKRGIDLRVQMMMNITELSKLTI